VFLPYGVDIDTSPLTEVKEAGSVEVKDGSVMTTLSVNTAQLGDLPIVLIDHPKLFRTRHPYGDQEGPYPDNWRRFALFARSVLESFEVLDFAPDVIHCMDWTSGLIPLLRELEYVNQRPDHVVTRAGTYFCINNLAMQGAFEREILPKIGIPHSIFQHVGGIELHGKVNFLKAGAEFATIVGTNSPHNAKRIQEVDRGYGLEETISRRAKELVGVTNGIDYHTWDPSNDPLLPQQFSAKDKDLGGKRKCKAALQQALNLDNGARIPVAVVIGRFDADSGFDLLVEVLTAILERNIEVVLMGNGRPEVLDRIRTMETTFTGRCRLIEGYHVHTAHTLLGGADLMISPSHYHPSNSLCAIALRYGVVPLAYANSGLEDTVIDIREEPRKGTGFMFHQYSGESLIEGIDEVRKHYKDPAAWKSLVMRCLKQDFSWQATAKNYLKAYRRVTRRVRSRKEAS
jgi:starch synthase